MPNYSDPIECNSRGLDFFAAGDPEAADFLLRKAYRNLADETGILVNLGLTLMQQGLDDQAERAYRLALRSEERRVRRSAKNLGFLLLWRGDHKQGWHWHSQRFEGENFENSQWRGDPLNGQTLTVWNDVGMGRCLQFVRYTLPYCSVAKSSLCSGCITNSIISRSSRLATNRSCGSKDLFS